MQGKRDLSFDAFKGLAIIAVVAIHAIYIAGSPGDAGFVYYRQLLNFSVPVFFFVAGYWSSKVRIESLKDYATFLTRRLSRILIPYFFWSAILIGYAAYRSGNIDLYQTVFKLFTGGACRGYYFVIAIAQLYFLTPILQYINRRFEWYGFASVLVFNLAAYFALYLSRLYEVVGYLPAALPFYTWVIYYEIGLFVSDRYDEKIAAPKVRIYIKLAVMVSLAIMLTEAFFILSRYNRPDFAASPAKYSTLLYSVCVIFGLLSIRGIFSRLPKLLSTIGCFSFGIYLIHVIILTGLAQLFGGLNALSQFQPVYQFILVVTATLVCFGIISVARKLLPVLFCSRILGF